jgi:iron(III) transport system substrate-binding protein
MATTRRGIRLTALATLLGFSLVAGCGGEPDAGTVVVYTSVTQSTVDAVVGAFRDTHPGLDVEMFRAPTGEVNARLAAERQSGGITANVLWMTDPLSMYGYDDEGLLADWTPDGADALPDAFVGDRFWGTRVLHLVAVTGTGVELDSWSDLTDPALRVAIPDPAFAGSAFAALGYFAAAPEFGFPFYETLAANGATELAAPGDVVTGVAEGRFDAGISLDFSVRSAVEQGSPVRRVWPTPGAIALSSPIAVVAGATDDAAARTFVEFVLSEEGQGIIGATGWVPARPGVPGPDVPPDAGEVFPDWATIWRDQQALLDRYESIFGG